MTELHLALQTILGQLDLRSLADILIIALIIYWVLLLLRGTTAMALLRGIVGLFLLGWVLSTIFQLTMLGWLLRSSLPAMLIVLPILFQPELRRVLEQIGRGLRGFAANKAADGMVEVIEQIVRACQTLAERRHGALIVLERDTGLQDYAETGIALDALPTAELLVGLFFPNAPLHDGALILRRGRIVAARCTLPLSEMAAAQPRIGMRHRAALGIAERTDAIAVVVSEETGRVSVAANGRLITPLEEHGLRALLLGLMQSRAPTTGPAPAVYPERPVIVPEPAAMEHQTAAMESAAAERGAR